MTQQCGVEVQGLNVRGEVLIFTHGEKKEGPDPDMTTLGFGQVRALGKFVPRARRCEVICGTGQRHLDVAEALRLTVTRFCPSVGCPDSLEHPPGRAKVIVLADGTRVPFDQYDLSGQREAALALLNAAKANTIICTGRPFVISLIGKEAAESAAVYCVRGNTVVKMAAHSSLPGVVHSIHQQ